MGNECRRVEERKGSKARRRADSPNYLKARARGGLAATGQNRVAFEGVACAEKGQRLLGLHGECESAPCVVPCA